MVIKVNQSHARRRGMLQADLIVAIAILALAAIPVVASMSNEQLALRAQYQRAVAIEIVDGEMEVLVAGAWRRYSTGQHDYKVSATAARNLPGNFILTRTSETLSLEWIPGKSIKGKKVIRTIAMGKAQP